MANSQVGERVEVILRDGPGTNERNLKSLLRAVSGTAGRAETTSCDLKTSFDGSNRSWVNIAKDIVAMSNSGGGIIVFGVDDDGRRVGLEEPLLSLMDPARINGKIEPRAPGARVDSSYFETTYYRLRYGFLCIHPQDDLIVFEREWGYHKPNGQYRTVIREGVLYARGVGETRPARQADVTYILRRLIETASKALLARIEQIATVPLDSEIVAVAAGSGGRGIRLVDTTHGLPVRVVSEGEEAVAITDVLTTDLPYSSKQAEFMSQVRTWRAGHPEHRVQRQLLDSWYLARGELEISDDMAEFGFLSAGYGHGYAIYWASLMTDERLDTVLEREIALATYPIRQTLPFVVGALRFSRREALLGPRLRSFQGAAGSVVKVLQCTSFRKFRCSGRMGADTFHLLGNTYRMSDLVNDQPAAVQLYEGALAADLGATQRTPVHQLDILIHARDDSTNRLSSA